MQATLARNVLPTAARAARLVRVRGLATTTPASIPQTAAGASQNATGVSQAIRANTPPAPIQIPPAEDPLLHFLASRIMRHGNRQQANRIVSRMLLRLHAMTRAPPLPVVRKAVLAMAPALRCVSTKIAARSIVTPMPLSEKQRTHYAVDWILEASKNKPGESLDERLAHQVVAIVSELEKLSALTPADPDYAKTMMDSALRKKYEVHKLAMMNRGNVRVSRRSQA